MLRMLCFHVGYFSGFKTDEHEAFISVVDNPFDINQTYDLLDFEPVVQMEKSRRQTT